MNAGVNSPTSIPMTPSAPSRGAEEAEGDDGGQYADQHRGESDGSEIVW